MPSSDPRLKTRARKALRAAVRRAALASGDTSCHHPQCQRRGEPIDYRPGARGPLAYDLDEIVARADGGSPLDPANVRPTHAVCNRRAGAVLVNSRRGRTTPQVTAWSSGRW